MAAIPIATLLLRFIAAQVKQLSRDGSSGAERAIATVSRQLIDSLRVAGAGQFKMVSENTDPTPLTQNQWAAVVGDTNLASWSFNFDSPSNGKLRYLGDQTALVLVFTSWSAAASANLKILAWRHSVDGAGGSQPTNPSDIDRKIGTAGDEGAAALCEGFVLDPGQTVELQMTNETDSTDGTVTHQTTVAVAFTL